MTSRRALVVETTTRLASVAAADGGQVVRSEVVGPAGVVAAVAALGVRASGFDAVYVSVGPGGFTGTRNGVTFAKTFAWAAGVPVVAVPTPRAVVENVPPSGVADACVVLDARRGFLWARHFTRNAGGWEDRGGPGLLAADRLADVLPRGTVLVGEGLAYHEAALGPAVEAGRVVLGPREAAWPKIETVASLGVARHARGEFADASTLIPAYVRRPEAEEKRLASPS